MCRSWVGKRRGSRGQSQRTKRPLALPLLSSRLGWLSWLEVLAAAFPTAENNSTPKRSRAPGGQPAGDPESPWRLRPWQQGCTGADAICLAVFKSLRGSMKGQWGARRPQA